MTIVDHDDITQWDKEIEVYDLIRRPTRSSWSSATPHT
jgi:hypothetical protein